MSTLTDAVNTLVSNTTTLQTTVSGRITDMDGKITQADTAKVAAEAAKAAAEIAKSGADTAKTDAETAKTLAESAKAAAGTAQGIAATAKTDALLAKSASETAKDNAVVAQTASESAKTNAQDWASKTTGAVAGGEYSAKYHATAASGSATTAASTLSDRYTKAETDAKIVALSPPATKAHVDSLGIAASSITGALPAISGANLTGILRHTTAASDPTVGAAGALYFNTVTSVLSVSDGTAWAPVYSPPIVFKFMQATNSSWWAGTLSADRLSWTHTPGTNRNYGAIIVDHVFTEDFEVIIESEGTSHSGGVAYKAGASLSDFDGYSADPAGAYMGNGTVWNISNHGSYSFATSYYPNGLYTGGANSHNWLRYSRTGSSVVLQTGQSVQGPWTNYQSFSSTDGILVGYGTAGSAYAPTKLISVTGK